MSDSSTARDDGYFKRTRQDRLRSIQCLGGASSFWQGFWRAQLGFRFRRSNESKNRVERVRSIESRPRPSRATQLRGESKSIRIFRYFSGRRDHLGTGNGARYRSFGRISTRKPGPPHRMFQYGPWEK